MKCQPEKESPEKSDRMLDREEKKILKELKKNILFVKIKSSISYTLKVVVISFIAGIFIQKNNNTTLISDITISLFISLLIYITIAVFLFKKTTLCIKLTIIYIKIKFKKLVTRVFEKY
ncbi:TPA: hypothetical protein R4229_002058 [Morganella morganii]|nr:hypothetical protein [Morganella morganii]